MEPINLQARTSAVTGHWQQEHLLTLNCSHSFKIAKIEGTFIWHCHPETDELVYCVSGGPFKIELATKAANPDEAEASGPDQSIELKVGDLFRVPRGMQHRPVTEVEAGILIVEKVGTINTGDREGDDRTVLVDEHLG